MLFLEGLAHLYVELEACQAAQNRKQNSEILPNNRDPILVSDSLTRHIYILCMRKKIDANF